MKNYTMSQQVVDRLNDILIYLHDSEKGYKECAKLVGEDRLRPMLMNEAYQRLDMIQDVESEIRSAGEKPSDHGSIAGPMHRLYLDFKALATRGNLDEILNEIKRGDNTLINTYKEVLRESLPPELDHTLHEQLDHVQNTIKNLDKASI